ncbi:MAG: hypothetical protein K9G24_06680 [Candidatus Nanopelagicales bacterium]|nr:hypothetical protein [Candidatus Nanopelagicales bacterium]MCF8538140.1 hypothetical protein [Candidatus Nanopelagicales bacterium]MCF8542753.1 hypothetical protein [Candidatus Nanopelagicales bacterium]MCF8557670.1 hypothetical protein [Candidatus Nanopelagicales bacterium]
MTIIIGIIGAFVGLGIGYYFGYEDTWFFVLLTQIFVAVILVAVTAALFRKSSAP